MAGIGWRQDRRILLRFALIATAMGAGIAACHRGDTSDQQTRVGVTPVQVPARPTFAKDVAPILLSQCAGCHRPGQGAPFPLLSFASARPRAEKIARGVSMRHMPPWLPDASQPPFPDERRLTDAPTHTFRRWAD